MNSIIYDNIVFTKDQKTGYYLSAHIIRDGKRIRLHVYIWEQKHGKTPKGMVVHHKDHNKENNNILNLEIITESMHGRLHSLDRWSDPTYKQKGLININNIRSMTKEWHASKEGLAWHSEHGKAVWNKQKEYIKSQTCKHCGKSYTVVQSRHEWSKFCSNTCKSAYRKASGVDDICRVCLICGSTFLINKYSKTKFCSKACVTVHRKNAEYAK